MWEYCNGYWLLTIFPIITVRLFQFRASSKRMWVAYFGNLPAKFIEPGISASDVMQRTLEYYDARIDLVNTEIIERLIKERIVYT